MPDGNVKQMKPSTICYLFSFLIFLNGINRLFWILRNQHNFESTEMYLKALLEALLGLTIAYLFYSHCTNCQGWQGFWKHLVLGVILMVSLSSRPLYYYTSSESIPPADTKP